MITGGSHDFAYSHLEFVIAAGQVAMKPRILAVAAALLLATAACSASEASKTSGTSRIPGETPSAAATPGTAATPQASGTPEIPESPGSGYWTRKRLLGAAGWRSGRFHLPSPGSTPTPRENAHAPRVGALFDSDSSGNHFCTASVVDSAGGNVLVTAAHCINSGNGGANRSNIVFIPDYANGQTPEGVWTPERYVMDPRWVSSADPDLDVAFIVLKPLDGKNIEDVLGGNQIEFNAGFKHLVRVTGYPSSDSTAIACTNWTSQQSQYQLKFACNDFTGGTSGSPWIANFEPLTRTGTIVGVIGGYQEGGDTAAVSYSSYLDDDIEKLFSDATNGSLAPAPWQACPP
jgi:V8-like Glu-specific endopeptidase